jgi:hypothetical protein
MKIMVEGVVVQETVFMVEVDASTEEEALEYVEGMPKHHIIDGMDSVGGKIRRYIVHHNHTPKDFAELGAFHEDT